MLALQYVEARRDHFLFTARYLFILCFRFLPERHKEYSLIDEEASFSITSGEGNIKYCSSYF
jgi:hypothetical protein